MRLAPDHPAKFLVRLILRQEHRKTSDPSEGFIEKWLSLFDANQANPESSLNFFKSHHQSTLYLSDSFVFAVTP